MRLFKRWRAKKAAKKQLKMEEEQALVKEKQQEEKITKTPADEKPKAKDPVNEPVKKAPSIKKEVAPEQEPAVETKEETKKESTYFRYHVSQNKNKNSAYFKQWSVKKSKSTKTIKYFKTQKEAIDYAEELAKNNDTTVVIHKVDGSIRKQNY